MTTKLISLLQAFDGSEEKYNDIVELAIEVLIITNDGNVDMINVNIVRNAGYHVYAKEKDSFGWLIGCIETPYGDIDFQ